MGVLVLRVNFKKWLCRMSLSLRNCHVPCRIYEMSMSHVTMVFEPLLYPYDLLSHVKFKKHLCRPVTKSLYVSCRFMDRQQLMRAVLPQSHVNALSVCVAIPLHIYYM